MQRTKRSPMQVENEIKSQFQKLTNRFLYSGQFKKRTIVFAHQNKGILRSHFHVTKKEEILVLLCTLLMGKEKKYATSILVEGKKESSQIKLDAKYEDLSLNFKLDYWAKLWEFNEFISLDEFKDKYYRNLSLFILQAKKHNIDVSPLKDNLIYCFESILSDAYGSYNNLSQYFESGLKNYYEEFEKTIKETLNNEEIMDIDIINFKKLYERKNIKDNDLAIYKNYFISELKRRYDYSDWEANDVWWQKHSYERKEELSKMWNYYFLKIIKEYPLLSTIDECLNNTGHDNLLNGIKCLVKKIEKVYCFDSNISTHNILKEIGLTQSEYELNFYYVKEKNNIN